MAKVRTKVIRQSVVLLAALVPMTTGLVAGSIKSASALGPGQFCLFLAPNAVASGIGHIGWGYQIGGTNTYVYGATENDRADFYVSPGGNNGYWQKNGSYNQMLNDFSGAFGQGNAHHDAGYYTKYRCTSVAHSAVGAANNAATSTKNAGYAAPGNDCLDHAIKIGNAYGAQMLPLYLTTGTGVYYYFPDYYFLSLINWEPIQALPAQEIRR